MKLTVNEKCIGCGVCVDLGEGAFVMKGGVSIPTEKVDLSDSKVKDAVKLAVEVCPVQAIEFEEN